MTVSAQSVQIEALTLVDLLRSRAEQQPDQLAYVALRAGKPAGEFTYQALDQRARAIAAGLQAELTVGDRAVLVYPYSAGIEFMAAFLGCLYAGIVAVPSHAPRNRYGLADLLARLSSAGAAALLTPAGLQSKLKRQFAASVEPSGPLRWIVPEQFPDAAAAAWVPPELTAETLAFLQYTSGSSGQPKGVRVTHGGLLHNQRALQQAFGHSAQTIGAGWLPLFHDMGLIGNALQVLYLGTFCVLMSPIDFMQQPVLWLQAISRYRATTSGGPNFAYDMLCRQVPEHQLASLDLSCWKVAFSGAEPVRPETMEQFSAKFATCGFRREAFYPCYGMAEAVLFIAGGQKSQLPKAMTVNLTALSQNRVVEEADTSQGRTLISCGHAWLDGEIAIADPQTQTLLLPDRVGEIWYASAGLGAGYWQQREQTEQSFRAFLEQAGEKVGPFLRTGDLGFLHQGELFITGRLHDVMVFWGINHYPQHIEQTVQACHPSFRQNGTAAFAASLYGQERLIIVQEIERRDRNQLRASDVIEIVRRKVFQEHFVDVAALLLLKPGRLPRTPSGKIQRRTCQAQFVAGTLENLDTWQATSTQPSDPATLVRRYLNPLTYLKGYTAIARSHLRHWLNL